jgi:beta-N-acetylhexosaminidase
MTLDEQIGQMLVPQFESTYLATDSDQFEQLAGYVRDQRVGGVIVFGGSQPVPGVLLNPAYASVTLGQPLAAASILNRLQAMSKVPLLAAADFEWGVGMRIAGATSFPRAMAFGAAGDDRLAAEAARITAVEARALGIGINFAPVADVNSNPRNPVINTRSFGERPASGDASSVSSIVGAYVRGLQDAGMLATLKHFPGHGDTDVDSHIGLPTIAHSTSRLEAIELPPFRAGIAAGAAAVMTSHILVPALDPAPGVPVTFSEAAVSVLRRDLGFGGLVFTDSMRMLAVARDTPPDAAALRAVQAGHDMVLDLPDPAGALQAIRTAVDRGEIDRARIAASAERILRAKARLGLHQTKVVDLDAIPSVVGGRAHRAVAQQVSQRSITLLKDDRGAVPLPVGRDASVLYLSVVDYPANWGISAPSRTVAPELRKRWPKLTAIEVSDRTSASEIELVLATAPRYDAIVAGVFVRAASASGRMDLPPALARLLNDLARRARTAGLPFVTVFFGNPYVPSVLPDLPAALLTYDFYDLAELSAVRAIAGEAPISGRLPISLPGLYAAGHGLDRPAVAAPVSR